MDVRDERQRDWGQLVLKCSRCGREYRPGPHRFLCDSCPTEDRGGILVHTGLLTVAYDMDRARRSHAFSGARHDQVAGMWRYSALLPFSTLDEVVSLGEGGTPLTRAGRLASHLHMHDLHLKQENINPTGAFKDRESSVAVTVAAAFGADTVACASTGTLAASLAAYASRGGLRCLVFVPESTPPEKTLQMSVMGATVIRVRGIYERAQALQMEACASYGWHTCSSAVNPYRSEGDKTIAYETCEQLDWSAPDWVIVPVGGGGDLSGQWRGYCELEQLGVVARRPRMAAVGTAAGAPLVEAFEQHLDHVEVGAVGTTIASPLVAAYTDYGDLALAALRESGGGAVKVDDEQLRSAQRLMATTEGVFAEPAGAASLAGLRLLLERGVVKAEDRVVCVVTGEGLHDPSAAADALPPHFTIGDSLDELDSVLQRLDR